VIVSSVMAVSVRQQERLAEDDAHHGVVVERQPHLVGLSVAGADDAQVLIVRLHLDVAAESRRASFVACATRRRR
jgi:hypothetical protein